MKYNQLGLQGYLFISDHMEEQDKQALHKDMVFNYALYSVWY